MNKRRGELNTSYIEKINSFNLFENTKVTVFSVTQATNLCLIPMVYMSVNCDDVKCL